MSYKFTPDEGVQEAVLRCAREQLDAAIHELGERIDTDPVVAVHNARKAVKKERALVRLARGGLDSRQRSFENRALRTAVRGLSGVRDAEVLVATLDDLGERFAGQMPASTLAGARAELERQRAAERMRTHESTLAAEALQRLAAVRTRIGDWSLQREGWPALDSGLTRTYGRGRKAFRLVCREPSSEHLHEWRKRAKDLWYALRLLEPVCGPTVGGQAKEAHRLADLLGDDHDLAVLRDRLARPDRALAVDIDELLGLIDYRRGELQDEAVHVGERVYVEKPQRFRRRLRGYWTAGEAQTRAWRDRQPARLAAAAR